MYKSFGLLLFLPLVIVACSEDEPKHQIFMQISTIINASETISRQISYDSYGRVISYKSVSPKESIVSEYVHVSDSLIKITTKYYYSGSITRSYTMQDDLHIENGRAVSCDGIFREQVQDELPVEKKYRHEFNYTLDNFLNTIKWTEWYIRGDNWEDYPWTWENYYYWREGNLEEIEDHLGQSSPTFTYSFKYTDVVGLQNVVPIPMGRYQYFPLQLQGVFGSQPLNLISEISQIHYSDDVYNMSYKYKYEIVEDRIVNYQEIPSKGMFDEFYVDWTK